jgi:integrase
MSCHGALLTGREQGSGMQITSESAKITKATVEAAWRRRAKEGRLIVRDKECRGLALIVNATSMVWSYAYRPRGLDPATGRRWPNRTLTLGNPATLSPDDARNEVQKARGQAATGSDPHQTKKASLAASQAKRSTTFDRLLTDYERALPRRAKMTGAGRPSAEYVAAELAQVRLALQAMDATTLPAADLTTQAIRRVLDHSVEGDNARARFGSLSRFLDWCLDDGHIKANPCVSIAKTRRPKPAPARSNFLEASALAILWKAAAKLREPVWRDIVRFLIAVPCRRSEGAEIDWSHVNLAAREWRQDGRLTKNDEPHRLLLTPLAMEVLEARRQAWAVAASAGNPAEANRLMAAGQPKAGLIFRAPQSGKAVTTFGDMKAELIEATKLEDENGDGITNWTWHDFRRSFASALGEAGIPEAVADAILNHRQAATRGGVLGVYQRSSRWPEQGRAMELWGRLLAEAIEGKVAEGKVVPMLRAR